MTNEPENAIILFLSCQGSIQWDISMPPTPASVYISLLLHSFQPCIACCYITLTELHVTNHRET